MVVVEVSHCMVNNWTWLTVMKPPREGMYPFQCTKYCQSTVEGFLPYAGRSIFGESSRFVPGGVTGRAGSDGRPLIVR